MLVKCDACKREFDFPFNKLNPGDSRCLCPACKKAGNMLSAEELEFAASEFPLVIQTYRLQNSNREISKMLDMTDEMIGRGIIKQNPQGIGRLWSEIFKRSPEVERHFQQFISTLRQETLLERGQTEDPREE